MPELNQSDSGVPAAKKTLLFFLPGVLANMLKDNLRLKTALTIAARFDTYFTIVTKRIVDNKIRFALGVWGICWGLSFTRWFDELVYFPFFPNILDAVGMVSIGVYLLWEALAR